MKKLFILSLVVVAVTCLANVAQAQDDGAKAKPKVETVVGKLVKNADTGNITLVTEDKTRYFIVKKQHEKVSAKVGEKVQITGGVQSGKQGGKMIVFVRKVEAPGAKPAAGKGKGKGKGKAE